MNKKVLCFIFLIIFLSSCKIKNKVDNDGANFNQISQSEDNNDNQTDLNTPQQILEDNIEFEWDETPYNDKATMEFCLNDKQGRNFCLYHNIRKVFDWDFDNFENYTNNNWCKQDNNNLKIIWNYRNGAILGMQTNDSNYSTKSGIKVGDPVSKVLDKYENSSKVFVFDKAENKFIEKSGSVDSLFWMLISDAGISINSGNLVDEEMMVIMFFADDGVINQIKISCVGDWD